MEEGTSDGQNIHGWIFLRVRHDELFPVLFEMAINGCMIHMALYEGRNGVRNGYPL